MKKFEMVKYGRWEYPADVPIRISEIAGHFDKSDIFPKQAYSLHTEYSFGSREFNSRCLNGLDVIRNSNFYGIPQLWKNREWAQEFAQFITAICAGHSAPEVIEVHPPFIDYTENMHNFVEVYKEFEYNILEKYPNVKICIENRCGSRYKTSPFLFSKYTSFFELCEEIQREHLRLKIAFDIPQLFTAEAISGEQSNRMYNCLRGMKMIREYFGSVHLWGKGSYNGRSNVAHHGNFDTWFREADIKNEFLTLISELFDDDVVRYMVLEVNSNNSDLISIINDLKSIDFSFVRVI